MISQQIYGIHIEDLWSKYFFNNLCFYFSCLLYVDTKLAEIKPYQYVRFPPNLNFTPDRIHERNILRDTFFRDTLETL